MMKVKLNGIGEASDKRTNKFPSIFDETPMLWDSEIRVHILEVHDKLLNGLLAD